MELIFWFSSWSCSKKNKFSLNTGLLHSRLGIAGSRSARFWRQDRKKVVKSLDVMKHSNLETVNLLNYHTLPLQFLIILYIKSDLYVSVKINSVYFNTLWWNPSSLPPSFFFWRWGMMDSKPLEKGSRWNVSSWPLMYLLGFYLFFIQIYSFFYVAMFVDKATVKE